MQRMRRQVRTLRTDLGHTQRQIIPHRGRQVVFVEELAMAKQLLRQEKYRHGKLYRLDAPEVECLSKGKAHKRYEFGVKVSITRTNKHNFIVGSQSLPGSPYDGHTLQGVLAQTRGLTNTEIDEALVDKGYRDHEVVPANIFYLQSTKTEFFRID